MTRPLIVDASAAVALLHSEPDGRLVEAALVRATRDGRDILVPSHFWLEVANAFRSVDGAFGRSVAEAVHHLDTYGIRTMEIDRALLLLAVSMAERYRLTAYDAAYLALAEAMHGELLTLDRALARAAGPSAIPLPGRHRLSEEPALYGSEVAATPTLGDYEALEAFIAELRTQSRREMQIVRGAART